MISPIMPNYKRFDLSFTQGEGTWLLGNDGRRYLDFGAGIAVSSLGHNHPELVKAITEQAGKVMHVSNLYRIPQAEALAHLLTQNSFADSVLFCNSGAEANEALVKIIRRAQFKNNHPEKTRIICFNGAFHGRTLAMISATGNPAYLEGFGPRVEGFDHVAFNDLEAVKAAVTTETAGILLEPIQGESGIQSAKPEFLRGLRALCDEKGLYLGIDEVQTGMGRTGTLFAYESSGIEPDVISIAKGIGGGFPLGAVLAREKLAKYLTPGTHGSTYGGNPLACAAGLAVVNEILKPGFLEHVQKTGQSFGVMLETLVKDYPHIFSEVRGRGLMRGLKCRIPVSDVLTAIMKESLLAVGAGDNVLRLVPPLIVTRAECQEAVNRIGEACRKLALSPTDNQEDRV